MNPREAERSPSPEALQFAETLRNAPKQVYLDLAQRREAGEHAAALMKEILVARNALDRVLPLLVGVFAEAAVGAIGPDCAGHLVIPARCVSTHLHKAHDIQEVTMPERTSYKPGTPSFVDLSTTDVAAAKDFYAGLFGWTYEDMDAGNGSTYTMASLPGRTSPASRRSRR